jgi:5-methylcytosine-specific restriction endonuclease McrA
MKKAMILVSLDKAETVELRPDDAIRGIGRTFPCPSVIRLKTSPRSARIKVLLNRKNVMKRDNFRCAYCGDSKNLTIDHIIPRSKGGKTTWENLVTACNTCNNKKDNKLLYETSLKLKITPRTPNRIVFLRQGVKMVEENWKPYLYLD